ncbi:hypothetical protein O1D97_04145 [Marinomonas sp. 15G1-11]|uniref:Uncharacterized protein n=1 Tax=Marinomonas phaeophyticola TaxID=3004091 RepID=A0ABT4JTC8_9GAMM|nr:hypothetical protein [Marinomonas sp. 15G1-11]MCZ2720854.1 hypothetical protein [Marinomonas sp. 15G1-11]
MYKKIPFQDCKMLFTHVELSEEAMALINQDCSPKEVIDILQKEKMFLDLTHFFCHALPMREVIWWTVNSLEIREESWSPAELQLLQDCKRWVKEPQEGQRRAIEQRLKMIKNSSAIFWLAQAVVWNGSGSIAAIDAPVVYPKEFLYSKAAAGAINTAAVVPEWKNYTPYYTSVFAMAIDLANGGPGMIKR